MKSVLSSSVLSLLFVSPAFAATAKVNPKPAPKPVVVVAPKPPPFTVAKALTPYIGLYQLLNTQAIWVQNGALSAQVAGLRTALTENPMRHGLNVKAYWTPALESMFQAFTPEQSDAFELAATQAFVNYSSDLSIGRVDPASVAPEVSVSRKAVPYDLMAEALKNTTVDLSVSMESLAPQWQIYRDLQAAVVRLSAVTQESFPNIIPLKKSLKLGASDPAYAAAKARLQTLGFAISEIGPVYTKELSAAVQTYYAVQTIPGTPSLDKDSAFWTQIAVSSQARIQQILMTMEKVRWMPHAPDARFGFVNTAQERLRVFENGAKVLDMKTINGRSQRKTPMLKDKITVVEFNPDWTVPTTLVVEDKQPLMLQNPNYLYEHHFDIVDENDQPVDEWSIPWGQLTKENANWFYLKQSPGLGNALGIMKFHLTNPYAIYLHDTNERDLFAQNHRLLSSGCVRLEHPLDLAQYLLRDTQYGDRATLEAQLATTEVIDPWLKKKNNIPLKQSMAVYLMYLTADATEGEPIKFAIDYYAQDTALYNALKKTARF